ncbi:GTP pyrophosphokinase YjbM [Methylophilaceae bacterium]|nr:GTP pyrophosphokinase YjbM [Methylophilaceae bacterium]
MSNLLDIEKWYKEKKPKYERLTGVVHNTMENLLQTSSIDYLAVHSRTKTLESLYKKYEKKQYEEFNKNTDFAGVRIITYIETDIAKVAKVIKNNFCVHEEKSLDKSKELETNKVGYRSVHFICELGKKRDHLPELTGLKGLLFEIQIRTVLQHAWAEIEHDRNYKFSGVLPAELKRHLYLLAGTLELIDKEFVNLAKEIDSYSNLVAKKTKAGNLDIDVNSTSLKEYFKEIAKKLKNYDIKFEPYPLKDSIFTELKFFGINTLKDLDNLLTKDFLKIEVKLTTKVGFLRDAMMYADMERYFETAWSVEKRWQILDTEMYLRLLKKYSKEELNRILNRFKIEVANEEGQPFPIE